MDIRMWSKRLLIMLFLAAVVSSGQSTAAESAVPTEARNAFASGDYNKAIEILNHVATSFPRDATVKYLIARCYFESEQYDRAISAAEAAVTLDENNSAYHELLGRAYGEKADRSGWMRALALAKKSRAEFGTAVRLDEHNFSAMQALIEFDCSAPGIAGGGEDKARSEIQNLSELDAAEGRYAAGNCRRQKKDDEAADAEFRKALALHPKSADLIYDIGDHYMKHRQADRLLTAIAEGERAAPTDLRGPFFRAVALTLQRQNSTEATKLFREYIAKAPQRNNYPSKAMAHYWLGQIHENQNNAASAKSEYVEALNLEPRNRFAKEALKRLQRD
jgi:tetratricopeptide (TPR) repeat protein